MTNIMRKVVWTILLINCGLVFAVHGQDTSVDNVNVTSLLQTDPKKNMTVTEEWEMFEGKVKGIANYVIKLLLPKIMESSSTLNVSSSCMRDTMLLIGGVRNIRTWALRFIDASGKMMDGILTGTMSSFGAYDQCVNTIAVNERRGKNFGKPMFSGRYCSLEIKPPLPPKRDFYKLEEVLDELKNFSKGGTAINEASRYAHFFYFLSFRLGICVPSGCSLEDIDKVAKILGDQLSVTANAKRCELKQETEFSPTMIFIVTMFCFAGFLMLIGSLIDIFAHYKKRTFKNTTVRVFLAFSLLSNFQKLANTKSSSDTLSCLNGIRFLCMSWIVLGHTYLNINFQLFRGLESVTSFARDFAFQAIVNASVAVDTFFFIGGLLICYLTIKLVKGSNKQFNIKLYIFHRLWRILPVYAFVIGFMFLSQLLGSGPVWYETTNHFIQACHENWWTNFLFVNNFYHADNMCLPQSWYIASDMQLYVAALLILLPLLRWPRIGISLSVLGIIASMAYSGIGTYWNDYPPTMLFAHPDPEQRNNYWANFYFKPFVHAGPYFIGILSGYLLATRPNLRIPKFVQVIGWCCAFCFNMSVLYGVWEWNKGNDPSFWESMFYSSCNRVAWTLGVAWMVICCSTGHGGVINYILSWKAWVPLGRLTFVTYLIHPIVQIAVVGNVRNEIQPQHFFAVWMYFGNLCVTYGAAFAGSMLIEAPFLALEKIILPRDGGKKVPNPTSIPDHSNLKGSLKVAKNGYIAAVIPMDDSFCNGEAKGSDNRSFVYKL